MVLTLAQQAASVDTVVWTGVVSGAIGSLAALGGVIINQRGERRKAHDDRIWGERASAYAAAFRWATQWDAFYMTSRDWPPVEPLPTLTEEESFLVQLYGSPPVVKAYMAAVEGAKSVGKGNAVHAHEVANKVVRENLDNMKAIIQRETQGVPEPRVPGPGLLGLIFKRPKIRRRRRSSRRPSPRGERGIGTGRSKDPS